MFLCECGREFANKSNLNRHKKSCKKLVEPVEPVVEATKIASPISEPDGKISEAQGGITPEMSTTQTFVKEAEEPGEQGVGMVQEFCVDLDKLPPNVELIVNFTLNNGERVFFDRLEPDGDHLWVKIDSWYTGRRMRKIHHSEIISVIMPEPEPVKV